MTSHRSAPTQIDTDPWADIQCIDVCVQNIDVTHGINDGQYHKILIPAHAQRRADRPVSSIVIWLGCAREFTLADVGRDPRLTQFREQIAA